MATEALRSAPHDRQARALSLPAHGAGSLLRRGDRILVDVLFSSNAESHVGALRSAGAQIVFVSARYQTVTVAVTPASLTALARVPGVQSVVEDLAPMVAGARYRTAPSTATATCPSGSVVSEGDTQLNAAGARSSLSVNGAGVKVGVLSDSFNKNTSARTTENQDVTSGDLPGSTNPCAFTTPVDVLADASSGEDEGRAMLQIVHDLAPGASLAFATGFNSELDFADQIRALRTDGADVIVDDITYFDEPFFQDGPVAVAVNDVTDDGAAYYSSAGNNNVIVGGHNAASFEAPSFRNAGSCPTAVRNDGEGSQCMDFKAGTGTDTTYGISVGNGSTVRIDLQWAQPWFGVQTDLDAYLLSSGGSILAKSIRANVHGVTGSTEKPFEFVFWANNTGSSKNVNLVIPRFRGQGGGNAGTPRLKLILTGNGANAKPNEYTTSSGGDVVGPAIFGHNGADSAMSVAAVPRNNSSTVESYSSRGPVKIRFGPVNGTTAASPITPKTVNKPDIAATDCGVTTFFVPVNQTTSRFCGTSAAAPHAAAVAALELQANPAASFDDIRNSQTSTASAVGSFGHTAVGAGLLNALAAASDIANKTVLTVKKAGTGNGTVTSVDGHISCGSTCAFAYAPGTSVTLQESHTSSSSFTGWSGGGCSGNGTTCTVAVNSNTTVTATFSSNDSTKPTAGMDKPAWTLNVGKSIPLKWHGSDDPGGSGLKNFDLRVRKAKFNANFGAFTFPSSLQHTSHTTATFTGAPGFTFCFSVRARDRNGNVSSFSKEKCTAVPIDDKQLNASAGWTRKSGQSGAFQSTLSVSSKKGATLKLSNLKAKRLGIMVKLCSGCGSIQLIYGSTASSPVSLAGSGFKIFAFSAFSSIRTANFAIKVTSTSKKVQIDGVIALRTGTLTVGP